MNLYYSGIPVYIIEESEAVLLGAAILAATAAGKADSSFNVG